MKRYAAEATRPLPRHSGKTHIPCITAHAVALGHESFAIAKRSYAKPEAVADAAQDRAIEALERGAGWNLRRWGVHHQNEILTALGDPMVLG